MPGQDDCTCFYSALSKTSIFHPVTSDGPNGVLSRRTTEEKAEVEGFLAAQHAQYMNASVSGSNSTQIYAPLRDGEIRVIEIHPGEFDAPLAGRLHVVSLDFAYRSEGDTLDSINRAKHTNNALSLSSGRPIRYTALSYTWGKSVFDQTMAFAQGSINITISLAAALRHLRPKDQSVFLWVDQICINQKDVADKVQQIPLMEKIFALSTNTVIWLGADDDDGSDPASAFDLMETVFARLQGTEARITPADFGRLGFPDHNHRSWWNVIQLLRRPWFTRLWTIQEAYLSKELFIKCGDSVACWDDFAVWCYMLDECGLLQWLSENRALDRLYSNPSVEKMMPPPNGAKVVNTIQRDRIQGLTLIQVPYLLEALVSTRYAQAAEPKDKIYGVLGMVEEKLVPDYAPTTSFRAVYHRACLTQLPHLAYELMTCVDHEEPLRPSWVPDWSEPRRTEALGYLTSAWTLYAAGGANSDSWGTNSLMISLSDDKSELSVMGKAVDTIAQLGAVCRDPKLDIENPQSGNPELASYIEMIRSSCRSPTYGTTDMTVCDAFLHTLLAGRDGSGVVPPSLDHSEVFSLIVDSITGHLDSIPGQTYSSRRRKGFFTLQSLKTRRPAKTLEDLQTALRAALKMRRFAITEKGFFALVPRGSREGDVIVVLKKACVPFVVRSVHEDCTKGSFELLGECYVQGIMEGEALEGGEADVESITLV